MKSNIVLIDLGVGNSASVVNAFKRIGCSIMVAREGADVGAPDKIVLPGVGAFDPAMTRLDDGGFRPVLTELVQGQGVPVLGICLGMQLLAESSEEGRLPGLGWLPAAVRRLESAGAASPRIPHMGWAGVNIARPDPIVAGTSASARFYFAHSYHVVCSDPTDVIATTDYESITFASVVGRDNVAGIQFHPEKSHRDGLDILRSFCAL